MENVKVNFATEFHALVTKPGIITYLTNDDSASVCLCMSFVQPSLWTREPILALRRLVFNETGLPDEVGVCWLQYAKLCREAGHYETASRAILQVLTNHIL